MVANTNLKRMCLIWTRLELISLRVRAWSLHFVRVEKLLWLPNTVSHTNSELKVLTDTLKSLEGETKVVMEHTGRYYEPIAQMLHKAGLFVSAVNRLLIKEFGNNSLRRVKTDKADAVKIARYALNNWTELVSIQIWTQLVTNWKHWTGSMICLSKTNWHWTITWLLCLTRVILVQTSCLTVPFAQMEHRMGGLCSHLLSCGLRSPHE